MKTPTHVKERNLVLSPVFLTALESILRILLGQICVAETATAKKRWGGGSPVYHVGRRALTCRRLYVGSCQKLLCCFEALSSQDKLLPMFHVSRVNPAQKNPLDPRQCFPVLCGLGGHFVNYWMTCL